MSNSLRTLAASLAALCLTSWLTTGVSAQQPPAAEVMTYANGRFERGELAEAVQLYESLLARGYGGTALYYNLGNAYLESGDFGQAIANYLRAEEVSPRNQDVKANLDLAPIHDAGPDRDRERLAGRERVLPRAPVDYARRVGGDFPPAVVRRSPGDRDCDRLEKRLIQSPAPSRRKRHPGLCVPLLGATAMHDLCKSV